jgi:WD40 repeat protein/tRNA A-37 threonylcarbamoyl transferase component Bud32
MTDRESRIEQISDEFLGRLQRREDGPDVLDLVKQFPDLAPELERRLRFVENVFAAIQSHSVPASDERESSTAIAPDSPAGDRVDPGRVVSVRCPHCGNLLKIVAPGTPEVTCGSCGSAVSVDPDQTRTDTRTRTPKFFGHFKILSFIGQGAFGTAYKAEDTRLNRIVAVKIPRSGTFATANDELRFVREARHAAQLRHPNIVQVHEIDNDRGMPFIVSDYIDGITLSDLISGRRLAHREAAEMIVTIADAVQFAHDNGVIHRDLKPGNILLDQQHKPYITDFGLARQTEGEFTMTLDGEVLGTPAYMSPEQAAGKPVDVRSDVYSLGVILYRLVCGELPFRGSQRMMIHQVLHDDPKPPRRLDERIPRDLETIVLKAMAKERERRYSSARDFGEDVRRWLRMQPIVARPVGIWGKSFRWCRRNPRGAAVIAALAGLLLTIAGISTAWAFRERAIREVIVAAEANRVVAGTNRIAHFNQVAVSRQINGDPFGGFPWYVESLALSAELAASQAAFEESATNRLQRLQLGLIQQELPRLTGVWGPGDQVQDVEFALEGKALFATTAGGKVQLISLDRSDALTLQESDSSRIWRSGVDPTGHRAYTASEDNQAKLWDLDQRKLVATLDHDARVFSATFSPNGKWVATAGDDYQAGLWDAADGKLKTKFKHPNKAIQAIVFSPDSSALLTTSRMDPDHPAEIRVWDIATGELKFPLLSPSGSVEDVVFDPNGERIIAGCDDQTIHVWHARSGEPIGEPLRQESVPVRLRLFEDGQILVAASSDGSVVIWDLASRQRLEANILDNAALVDFDADPSGRMVAMAQSDHRTRVFWRYCGQRIGPDLPHGGHPTAIAFHPDGRRIAVGGDDGVIRLWDLAGLAPTLDPVRTGGQVTALEYHRDGKMALVASRDDAARQQNVSGGQVVGEAMRHGDDVVDSQYDSAFRRVVTAGADGLAQVWDANSGKPIGPPMKHDGPVVRAGFIPGTDEILTTTVSTGGALWTVGASAPHHRFTHGNHLVGLALSLDGKSFATGCQSPECFIRSSATGQPLGDALRHSGDVYFVKVSPSGRLFASGSSGGSVILAPADGKTTGQKHWDLGCGLSALSFAASDDQLLTADDFGELTWWSTAGESPAARWSTGDANVRITSVEYLPDFGVVASLASRPREAFEPGVASIRFNHAATGALLCDLPAHFRPAHLLKINPLGEQFATGSSDGTVRFWNLREEDMSLADLRRLARVYTGASFSGRSHATTIPAAAQVSEFEALRREFPRRFECSADEIRRWDDELAWVIQTAQDWPNRK